MYIEIKTADLSEIEKFVRENAQNLASHKIEIKIKSGKFVAELYSSDESPT